jgi:LuxR family transcriptional regulator, maltose regulon positive regulatory protein
MGTRTAQREIQIPRVIGAITRPRLLAQLEQVLDHKLTLVCAPPGFGKTTLVAQYASRTSYNVAWHALEGRERDLPNLFNASLLALETVLPGIRALTSTPSYFAGEQATAIIDYLREHMTLPIVYVIDDIQVISGSAPAEAWLQSFVEQMPPHVHMILIGRVLPNLPLTEMIARAEVLALGQDRLRFTPQEIFELSRETGGVVRTIEAAEDLASRLEGWPAGTVLALHPLPADLEHAILRGGSGPESLFDALAESILEAQSPGLRDFLLASSTLIRMTPELCANVLQIPNSTHWAAEAQQRNLFLSRVAGGLVYHRLFRNFLQQQLRKTNPDLYLNLHKRAALYFQRHNHIDRSFMHYLAAGLYENAAKLADEVALTHFSQGRTQTLIEWRAELGEAGVIAPNLLYNCARAYTDRYNYELAETALDGAEQGYIAVNDPVGQTRVKLQRAFIALQRGNYHAVDAMLTRIADAIPNDLELKGNALKILGVARLRMGEVTTAVTYLEEASGHFRGYGDAYALANVLQDLSVAFWQLGRFDQANACLQEVVALRRSLGSPGALAGALNNLGSYYHRSGHYDQAIATFEEGLRIVTRVPNRRVESALLWSLGELRRDLSMFDEALQLHNRSLALIGSSDPWLRCAVMISCSQLYRWSGKIEEGRSLATKAIALADEHEFALERAMARAAFWATQTLLGQAAAARTHLDDVMNELQRQGARSEMVQVNALSATAAMLCSDQPAADHLASRALEEAQAIGALHVLAAEVGHTPLLETHIVKNASRYGDLIRALKRLRNAQTQAQPHAQLRQVVPQTTYSLRIYTLGREHIERDGEPISLSDWRSHTAREMFYFLLFEGAQNREQISLAFWPDHSTGRVRSNFHTTLYRARQALGENAIRYLDGFYRLDPDLDLWCDALEMETLVQQARLLPPRDARTEDLWRRAVTLYKGEFLPSWSAEWTILHREHAQEIYVEALIGLGQCTDARGEYREALQVLRRALDVDPFREDVHRAIMTTYANRGEKQQVLNHLKKLQKLLDEELGIDPSRETMELAAALLE